MALRPNLGLREIPLAQLSDTLHNRDQEREEEMERVLSDDPDDYPKGGVEFVSLEEVREGERALNKNRLDLRSTEIYFGNRQVDLCRTACGFFSSCGGTLSNCVRTLH